MSSAAAHDPAAGSTSASARVAELFERHGRMVYGINRAMLRDVHDAEDATQQTFLAAHRALLAGAHVRDTGAWIATIARNECRSRISAGMRVPLPATNDLGEIPQGVDEVDRRMQAGELRDALSELPERQREAVVLRYVHGLRCGEVAKALGLSRPATEALLFRARRAMRVRLRHVAGSAIVVPFAVREELALAIPGFEVRAGSGAAAGFAGGLLAKLASAPAAAKVATATVAISTVGAVGAIESDGPTQGFRTEVRLAALPLPGASAPGVRSSRTGTGDDGAQDVSADRGSAGVTSDSDDDGRGVRETGALPTDDRGSVQAPAFSGGSSDGGSDDESTSAVAPVGSIRPGSGKPEGSDPDDDPSPNASSGASSDDSSAFRSASGHSDDDEADDEDDASASSGLGSSGSESAGSEASGSGSSGSGSSGTGSDDGGSGSASDDAPEDESP